LRNAKHSFSKVGPNNVSNKWDDDENPDYVDDDFEPATLVHQAIDSELPYFFALDEPGNAFNIFDTGPFL